MTMDSVIGRPLRANAINHRDPYTLSENIDLFEDESSCEISRDLSNEAALLETEEKCGPSKMD